MNASRKNICKILATNPDISLEDLASKEYHKRCKIPILRCTHMQAIKMAKEYESRKNKNQNNSKNRKYENRSYWRNYYQKMRLDVLEHYSNGYPCCELLETYPDTCGGDCVDLLTIDHEGGGGIDHHRDIKRGNIYYWLKKNGYPEGYVDKNGDFHKFRLLCHNCNHLERLRMQKEKDMETMETTETTEAIIIYSTSNVIKYGLKVGVQSGNPIYKNILDDIMQGINQKLPKIRLRKIFKEYYPHNKSTTLETKIGIYKNFIIQQQDSLFKKI